MKSDFVRKVNFLKKSTQEKVQNASETPWRMGRTTSSTGDEVSGKLKYIFFQDIPGFFC